MATRTPDLFAALRQRDTVPLLLELIRGDRRVGELTSATGIPQPTATRRLAELQAAGLLARRRRGSPYSLTNRAAVCDFLREASALAASIPGGDPSAESAFQADLRARGCGDRE